MKLLDLPLDQLHAAPWNPNRLEAELLEKLATSIRRFGIVAPLVVRPLDDSYEVVSGNQRLGLYQETAIGSAACIVVDVDDANARLLAQALNHLHGEDNLGQRAAVLRYILAAIPDQEVLSLLPETADSLSALASLGQADLGEQLAAWQSAQAARLHHLTFQLTAAQLEVVEEALNRVGFSASTLDSATGKQRANALFWLCQRFLEVSRVEGPTQ